LIRLKTNQKIRCLKDIGFLAGSRVLVVGQFYIGSRSPNLAAGVQTLVWHPESKVEFGGRNPNLSLAAGIQTLIWHGGQVSQKIRCLKNIGFLANVLLTGFSRRPVLYLAPLR